MMGGAIARLRAAIGLDSSEFKAGTQRVKGEAGALQKTLGRVGGAMTAAFSIATVVAWGRSVITTFADVAKAAENLNMPTKDMVGLTGMATKAGIPDDQLHKMLAKIQTAQKEVAEGNEDVRKSYQDLGIDLRAFISSSPAEALVLIAKEAQKSLNPVSTLGDLFGEKLGSKSLSMLKTLANEGIQSVDDATVEAIENIDKLDDKWSKFKYDAKLKTIEGVDKFLRASPYEKVKSATRATVPGSQIIKSLAKTKFGEKVSDLFAPLNPFNWSKQLKENYRKQKDGVEGKSSGKNTIEFYDKTVSPYTKELQRIFDETEKNAKTAERDRVNTEIGKKASGIEDEIERKRTEVDKLAESATSNLQSINPGGLIRADQLTAVGGSVGGYRPDIAQSDRQAQEQKIHTRLMNDQVALLTEIAALNKSLQSVLSGRIE